MVRRPWLRRTRLLAGAPTGPESAMGSPLGRPEGSSADIAGTWADPFVEAAFLAATVRCGLLCRKRRVTSDSRRSDARCMVVPGMVEMANLTRWSGFVGVKNDVGPGIS